MTPCAYQEVLNHDNDAINLNSQNSNPRVEELDKVQIHPDFPHHVVVLIGSKLEVGRRAEELVIFLTEHHDCFAWSHEDMT